MSNCGVCIGGYDFDGCAEFLNVEMVKARKAHKCEECGRTIAAGEVYERCAMKFDGDFSLSKTCGVCAEIRDAFNCDEGGGVVLGELWEDMRYVYPQLTTGCFDRLNTAKAKTELLRRWQEWKGII